MDECYYATHYIDEKENQSMNTLLLELKQKHLILYYMIHANIKYMYKRTVIHVSISDINEYKSYIAVVR